jgi:nitrate reductase cytochrome c-type subunit
MYRSAQADALGSLPHAVISYCKLGINTVKPASENDCTQIMICQTHFMKKEEVESRTASYQAYFCITTK